MAPGDDADAVFIGIDLFDGGFNLVRTLAGCKIFDGDGHAFVDVVCHLFGVLRDMFEDVSPVQRLRTGDPINDLFFHFNYLFIL